MTYKSLNNSAKLALAVLAAVVLPAAWASELKLGGSGGPTMALRGVAEAFHKQHPDIRPVLVNSLGTRGGIRAVAEGALEIGVASRELKPDEAAKGLTQVEFARTPFVFATPLKNQVRRISLREVVEIYAGRRTAWPDGTRLRPVLRPEGDSDTMFLRGISEELRQASAGADKRPGMVMAITDLDNTESLETVPGAFGATTLSQILVEGRAIRALALDGVAPTAKNAAAGSYALSKRFYLVLPRAPSAAAREFVDFVGSQGSRALLAKTGHWFAPTGEASARGSLPGK